MDDEQNGGEYEDGGAWGTLLVQRSHEYGLHCGNLMCPVCAEMVRAKLCPTCGEGGAR